MKLSEITLRNFRSYTERQFVFSDDVTIITGRNGAGKTNLLEAIYLLFMGRSFRDADNDLIKHDENWFRVSGVVGDHHREIRYQPDQQVRKSIIVDDQPAKRFTYHHQLPVVLFEPDDMLMVHGSPSLRRGYLDDILVKTEPAYRTTLARYERALLQRNNLLKKGLALPALRDAVFVWDVALAEYGATIQAARTRLIEKLNRAISEIYSTIAAERHTVSLQYTAKVYGDNQRLANSLAQNLESDRLRGTTTIGPHRDDVTFVLNGKPAKQTASRGEVRTLVLALKQFELRLLEVAFSKKPLFLLDDVLSELDRVRQTELLRQTHGIQKIITATHIELNETTVIEL